MAPRIFTTARLGTVSPSAGTPRDVGASGSPLFKVGLVYSLSSARDTVLQPDLAVMGNLTLPCPGHFPSQAMGVGGCYVWAYFPYAHLRSFLIQNSRDALTLCQSCLPILE